MYLCSEFEIGLWCNGNTADSGPAFPGSSPGSPAEKRDLLASLFFVESDAFNEKETLLTHPGKMKKKQDFSPLFHPSQTFL